MTAIKNTNSLCHESLHVFVVSIQQLKLTGESERDFCLGLLLQSSLSVRVIVVNCSLA